MQKQRHLQMSVSIFLSWQKHTVSLRFSTSSVVKWKNQKERNWRFLKIEMRPKSISCFILRKNRSFFESEWVLHYKTAYLNTWFLYGTYFLLELFKKESEGMPVFCEAPLLSNGSFHWRSKIIRRVAKLRLTLSLFTTVYPFATIPNQLDLLLKDSILRFLSCHRRSKGQTKLSWKRHETLNLSPSFSKPFMSRSDCSIQLKGFWTVQKRLSIILGSSDFLLVSKWKWMW